MNRTEIDDEGLYNLGQNLKRLARLENIELQLKEFFS